MQGYVVVLFVLNETQTAMVIQGLRLGRMAQLHLCTCMCKHVQSLT